MEITRRKGEIEVRRERRLGSRYQDIERDVWYQNLRLQIMSFGRALKVSRDKRIMIDMTLLIHT
jgi:hypothetical protein